MFKLTLDLVILRERIVTKNKMLTYLPIGRHPTENAQKGGWDGGPCNKTSHNREVTTLTSLSLCSYLKVGWMSTVPCDSKRKNGQMSIPTLHNQSRGVLDISLLTSREASHGKCWGGRRRESNIYRCYVWLHQATRELGGRNRHSLLLDYPQLVEMEVMAYLRKHKTTIDVQTMLELLSNMLSEYYQELLHTTEVDRWIAKW